VTAADVDVDVLVVTWNTGELTAQCLRRLLDSDQGVTLRVLVHDNASTDGTVEVLRQRVPEADVVAGASNGGFAAGVNALLERSAAPWLLVLNSDAWPEPHAVGTLVASAQQHPRAGIVAPRLETPDGALELSTGAFPSVREALRAAGSLQRFGHDHASDVDWAVGACWLVRRDALSAVGPLDETFFMYGEDVEWCWRMRDHGWAVRFEPVGNASGASRYADDARTRAWVANDLVLVGRRAPRSLATYRAVRALGARRAARIARRRGNEELAEHWRAVARAYLRRS
jgi:GT2 family glycosyltransferase